MTENAHCLIGKTITAVYLAADKEAVRFDIEGGDPIVARCEAECCSSTWVENTENHRALIGSPVIEADDIDMPDHGSPSEDGVIAYYGFKISTMKGTCVIDYRNSSNGYYGGDLVWPGEILCGGVFDQDVSKEEWTEVR